MDTELYDDTADEMKMNGSFFTPEVLALLIEATTLIITFVWKILEYYH